MNPAGRHTYIPQQYLQHICCIIWLDLDHCFLSFLYIYISAGQCCFPVLNIAILKPIPWFKYVWRTWKINVFRLACFVIYYIHWGLFLNTSPGKMDILNNRILCVHSLGIYFACVCIYTSKWFLWSVEFIFFWDIFNKLYLTISVDMVLQK